MDYHNSSTSIVDSSSQLSPIDLVLSRLKNYKAGSRGYTACCPAHNDRHPSLMIWEDETDGHVGIKCFVGCSRLAVCEALGLTEQDLYRGSGQPRKPRKKDRKIDLRDLALDKLISPPLLVAWGVSEGHTYISSQGKKIPGCIRIPYLLPDRTEHTQSRIRTHVTAKQGSFWEGTGELIPYGLWKLAEAREAGYCLIVEGESDAWTCWRHDIPALGIPGASNAQVLQAGMLDDIPRLYIACEPDEDGKKFPANVTKRLREVGYQGECFSLDLHAAYGVKDCNALHKQLAHEHRMQDFPAELLKVMSEAPPVTLADDQALAVTLESLRPLVIDAVEKQDAPALYDLTANIAELPLRDQEGLKSLIQAGMQGKPGFSWQGFKNLLKQAMSDRKRSKQQEQVKVSGRPQILLGRQLREEIDDCLDALYAANAKTPVLFIRNRLLVRIDVDERGRPAIVPVGESAMLERLMRVADFVSYNEESDEYRSQHPSKLHAQMILHTQGLKFPPLADITEIPIMRPDGTILDTPGYDHATRLYYLPDPALHIPAIPDKPAARQVRAARDFAFSFFSEFPYKNASDRANAYGLLLTLVSWQFFGLVPQALLDTPTRGTGKTLWVNALSIVAHGQPAIMERLPRADDELRKKLTTLLLAGERMIVFDNVESVIDSPVLAQFATAHIWGDRILGTNTSVSLDKEHVLTLLNGNNLQIGGDMDRRVFRICMDAGVSRPYEMKRSYTYDPLLSHVRARRGEILAALLTIVRAWYLAGCPRAMVKDSSDFGPWKQVIGGMLQFIEVKGFLENQEELLKDADREGTQWLNFLTTWREQITEAVTVKKLFEHLNAEKIKIESLHAERNAGADEQSGLLEALPDALARWFEKDNRRMFGATLAKYDRRPFGPENLKLVKGEKDKHSKQETWRVVASPSPVPPAPDENRSEKKVSATALLTEESIPQYHTDGHGETTEATSPLRDTLQEAPANSDGLPATLRARIEKLLKRVPRPEVFWRGVAGTGYEKNEYILVQEFRRRLEEMITSGIPARIDAAMEMIEARER